MVSLEAGTSPDGQSPTLAPAAADTPLSLLCGVVPATSVAGFSHSSPPHPLVSSPHPLASPPQSAAAAVVVAAALPTPQAAASAPATSQAALSQLAECFEAAAVELEGAGVGRH